MKKFLTLLIVCMATFAYSQIAVNANLGYSNWMSNEGKIQDSHAVFYGIELSLQPYRDTIVLGQVGADFNLFCNRAHLGQAYYGELYNGPNQPNYIFGVEPRFFLRKEILFTAVSPKMYYTTLTEEILVDIGVELGVHLDPVQLFGYIRADLKPNNKSKISRSAPTPIRVMDSGAVVVGIAARINLYER